MVIQLPKDVEDRLLRLASKRGRDADEIAVEAIADYLDSADDAVLHGSEGRGVAKASRRAITKKIRDGET